MLPTSQFNPLSNLSQSRAKFVLPLVLLYCVQHPEELAVKSRVLVNLSIFWTWRAAEVTSFVYDLLRLTVELYNTHIRIKKFISSNSTTYPKLPHLSTILIKKTKIEKNVSAVRSQCSAIKLLGMNATKTDERNVKLYPMLVINVTHVQYIVRCSTRIIITWMRVLTNWSRRSRRRGRRCLHLPRHGCD